MPKTIISERWELIPFEIKKWLDNQKSFLAPLGMFYVAFVITQVGTNGFTLSDFVPGNAVLAAMALYLLNAVYDLLRKWAGKHSYKQ